MKMIMKHNVFKELAPAYIEEKDAIKKDNSNIRYLKRRDKKRKKTLDIVTSLLGIFLVLITAYYFVFINMWQASSSNVETNIQRQGTVVTLLFKAIKDNHYIIITDVKKGKEIGRAHV